MEDIRLDYVPLSGGGGLVFDNAGNFGLAPFRRLLGCRLMGRGMG